MSGTLPCLGLERWWYLTSVRVQRGSAYPEFTLLRLEIHFGDERRMECATHAKMHPATQQLWNVTSGGLLRSRRAVSGG